MLLETIHSCVITAFLAGLPTESEQTAFKTNAQKEKSAFSGG